MWCNKELEIFFVILYTCLHSTETCLCLDARGSGDRLINPLSNYSISPLHGILLTWTFRGLNHESCAAASKGMHEGGWLCICVCVCLCVYYWVGKVHLNQKVLRLMFLLLILMWFEDYWHHIEALSKYNLDFNQLFSPSSFKSDYILFLKIKVFNLPGIINWFLFTLKLMGPIKYSCYSLPIIMKEVSHFSMSQIKWIEWAQKSEY